MEMIFKSVLFVLSSVSLLQIPVQGGNNISCNLNKTVFSPDYYWRDYLGDIPQDAVEGGTDKKRNPTYIGQVYIKEFGQLPATISPGSLTVAASAHSRRVEADKYIKILCSNVPNKLSWVATKNEETHLLTKCQFVEGGTENDETLYIGRVNHGGQTVIGKIFSYPISYGGLYIPDKDHETRFLTYEILTYNCDLYYY